MTPADAARLLGVARDAGWDDVRRAYRDQIRSHHPDTAGAASADRASRINEAYRVLELLRHQPPAGSGSRPGAGPADPAAATRSSPRPPAEDEAGRRLPPEGSSAAVWRVDGDSILLAAPADEAFRALMEAAHDIGEITYVDRSMPIMEVLCRFEGEPATSLLLSLQGRSAGTEVLCSVESIEDRPAPPAEAVVDLLELALHRRAAAAQSPSSGSE